MMPDPRTTIQVFLKQCPPISLLLDSVAPDGFTKAGLVPFLWEEGELQFYVMKPHGKMPNLGAPPYQLGKGTRMYFVPGVGWRDMRDEGDYGGVKESLAETALREGMEELGVELTNIKELFDLGPYHFSSATTGKSRQMWLLAAQVREADGFMSASQVAHTTEAREWLSVSEFAVVGRADHHYILQDIEKRLKRHFKE